MSQIEDTLRSAEFGIVRKGYDPEEVGRFLARMAEEVAGLDAELRAAGVRERALERDLSALQAKDADPNAVFLSATETKERLLAKAKAEAARIVDEAKASVSATPTRTSADVVAKALEEAEAVEAAARAYAETILAEARREARVIAEKSSGNAESLQQYG